MSDTIRWLTSDAFWDHWPSTGGPPPIDYLGWCYFEICESELRAWIGDLEPNADPVDEGDQPGPVLRWYGDLEGIPVLFDLHLSHPRGQAVVLRHGQAAGARSRVLRRLRHRLEGVGNRLTLRSNPGVAGGQIFVIRTNSFHYGFILAPSSLLARWLFQREAPSLHAVP